jgi:uncharacterized protein
VSKTGKIDFDDEFMRPSKRKKIGRIVAILFASLLVLFLSVVEFVMPYIGIKPYRRNVEDLRRWQAGVTPEAYGLRGEKISIETRDSVVLQAWLCRPTSDDSLRGTVIVLHGIGSCKETQFGRAQQLAAHGYAALLLDLRAQGESSGEYNTFGFREKYDLQDVVSTLEERFQQKNIGIWGASLGGAIALQAMGHDPRICFGIIESTFDEYIKVCVEYGEDYLGFKSRTLAQHVVDKAGSIAHFESDSVMPYQYAARIRVPMLFIHGDQDEKIPIDFNKRNYEVCPSENKAWLTVPGGRHNNLWMVGGEVLKKTVDGFLESIGG